MLGSGNAAGEGGGQGEPDSKRLRVTIDPLHIKRIRAIDEAGNEEVAEEPAPDQKLLAQLARVDFRQTAAEEEKEDAESKEAAARAGAAAGKPEEWPWQTGIEQLVMAQEELRIILDIIASGETGQGVAVANVGRAKLAPAELASNLALQVAVKQKACQDVGKGLHKSAQAMSRQLEHQEQFYGSLMRLQRQWKVRRQRLGAGALSSDAAGFAVDLSFQAPSEGPPVPSHRTAPLLTVPLEQNQSGLLSAHPPPGRPLRSLQVDLVGCAELDGGRREQPQGLGLEEAGRRRDGEGSEEPAGGTEEGSRRAQAVLQRVQASLLDEQLFDALEKETFGSGSGSEFGTGSGPGVTGMGEAHLDVSTGHGPTLRFHLNRPPHPATPPPDPQSATATLQSDTTYPAKDKREPVGTAGSGPAGRRQAGGEGEGERGGSEGLPAGGVGKGAARGGAAAGAGPIGQSRPSVPVPDGGHVAPLDIFTRQAYLHSLLAGRGSPLQAQPGRAPGRTSVGAAAGRGGGRLGGGGGGGGQGVGRGRGQGSESGAGAGLLERIVPVAVHRAVRASVLRMLERQVRSTPHLELRSRATWHPTTSAWDLILRLPGGPMAGPAGAPAQLPLAPALDDDSAGQPAPPRPRFQCQVVLRGEEVSVEAMQRGLPLVGSMGGNEEGGAPLADANPLSIPQLSTCLLHQVAVQMVAALHEEASALGLRATRVMLSVVISLEEKGKVVMVAMPNQKAGGLLWVIRGEGSSGGEGGSPVGLQGSSGRMGPGPGPGQQWRRDAGVLDWQQLRRVLLDLLAFR